MSCTHLHQTSTAFTGTKENKRELLYKRLLLLGILLLGALLGSAQRPSEYCLKVKILPTVDGQAIKGASYKVIRDGVEQSRVDTCRRRSSVFYLEQGSEYLIEVSAPGRMSRKVAVNTVIPGDMPSTFYKCVMEIELPSAFDITNEYYQDFPIAVVKYDPEKVRFSHNREYTETVRMHMEQGGQEDAGAVPSTADTGNDTTAPAVVKDQK